MADISKITLPNGSTYDIKDATARSTISTITNSISGGIHYRGVTTTALTDGSTTNPIKIDGVDYAPQTGDIVIYGKLEFIYAVVKSGNNTTSSWHEFGSTGSLKALAFKDTATANVTSEGTVSAPAFTGKAKSVSVSGNATVIIPKAELRVEDVNTGKTSILLDAPGTATTDIVTPTAKATGTAVSLNTTSIDAVDSVGSLPSWSASVNGETLSFSFNAGSLPTKAAKTVATGVSSVTQPTITCGQLQVIVPNASVSMTSTGSYTPEGTNSEPEFTGTSQTIIVE